MPHPPSNHPSQTDDTVSRYIADLRRRWPEYQREHDAELRQIGTDFLGRLFQEHILFGERTNFEAELYVILTPAERDQVQTDPQFTQAWHIFVDLCWMRKRLKRALLVGLAVLALLAIFWGIVWMINRPDPRKPF